MNDNFDAKLNLYMRAERAMLTLTLREKVRQMVYITCALLALLTTLILLNIGAFYTLLTYLSPQLSAFTLAGLNLLLILIMLMLASKKKNTAEVEALSDIRDFAKTQVMTELQASTQNIVDMSQSIKHVADDVNAVLSGEAFGLQGLISMLHRVVKPKQN
jgi:hypothetical protein